MKIKITAKHLKNADFFSHTNCPLAKALRDLGYNKIHVGSCSASAYKNGKETYFQFGGIANLVGRGKPFTMDVKIYHEAQ
jgi:hypothetical protein